jgi:hypothetical protein
MKQIFKRTELNLKCAKDKIQKPVSLIFVTKTQIKN